MGLDMYLYNIESKNPNFEGLFGIEEDIYWRKANAIHKWFVENVQNYQDDCEIYPVSEKKLKELLNTCNEVLNDYSKAEELLPTTCGFFFGSTEYDDDYFEDLIYTKNKIEKLFKDNKIKNLYYVSSW